MRLNRFCIVLTIVAVLAGCSSGGHRAPVVEHGEAARKTAAAPDATSKQAASEKDWRPQVHIVQKGDTLYSIAFNYGLSPRELTELNAIHDPNVIQIGQQIRLFPADTPAPAAPVETKPAKPFIKEQPKLVKYEYSEAALAQINKVQEPAKPEVTAVAKVESKPKQEVKTSAAASNTADDGDDEALEWSMPAHGKVVAQFSESANSKGIDIAGKLGQPVIASAPGKVVYSGNGLRGYGKLIIIKHNKTYISAYAHNDQVLVKEGQTVTRGQKIAEMGSTDADQVKLHFEVRRFGKPVDPAKYLPLNKS